MQRYRRGIEDVRQVIATRIRAALPGETGEIALALITGERGGISAATNNAFKNSGLFHILSISGPAHGDRGRRRVLFGAAVAGAIPFSR